MTSKLSLIKSVTLLCSFSVVMAACTKQRTASLPDDKQENVFAISEIPQISSSDMQKLDSNTSPYKMTTDSSPEDLSYGDTAKAANEKGLVAVDSTNVPSRLSFMFSGLKISGQPNTTYPVTFSVDKQFVTVYKVSSSFASLSLLEQQLAMTKEEVLLQQQIQKESLVSKIKSLVSDVQQVRLNKQSILASADSSHTAVLVPLFKYKVAAYGTLVNVQNDLHQNTSVLRLKNTDWSHATHVQISDNPADRIPVALEAASSGDLDRTFVMNKLNNKLMTAETLSSQFDIPVNLDKNTRVLTLLDVNSLDVFEVGQLGKMDLTDSQVQQLKIADSVKNGNVKKCSADIIQALPADAQKDCVMVLRYAVPVTYVVPQLPAADYDGNQTATLKYTEVRAADNVGLIQIAKNVEPTLVQPTNSLDPRSMIRVADIKDKEFFFKRTLEDAPVTTTLAPGMAGNLTIVKFEMQENRLVVRKADNLVAFQHGSDSSDVEELMSVPVTYWKYAAKDPSGVAYATPHLIQASRVDAEIISLDWTQNTLPEGESPYAGVSANCISAVADNQVVDVDMRMDQGALSFSYQYSVNMKPSMECIGLYSAADDYNGTAAYQQGARLKERVSFKLNDGSSDQSFVGQVPFRAQNAMGYGVWTIGKISPTSEGLRGHVGQETNYNVVQDFRNNRVVTYTLTGLPTDDPEMRQLYIDTAKDVIAAWNKAYHQVFKGSAFDRSGDYLAMQIAGENGVEAHLGDIDKNILHFENKTNDNHGTLGVSQVAFNPRSGIVVADSLIIYAGNLKHYVAALQGYNKIYENWDAQKAQFHDKAVAQMSQQQSDDKTAPAQADAATPPADARAKAVSQLTRSMVAAAKTPTTANKTSFQISSWAALSTDLKNAAAQMQAAGGSDRFKYSPPNIDSAWVDRVLKQAMKSTDLENMDLEGMISQEMVNSFGDNMSPQVKARLQRRASLGQFRQKLQAHMEAGPGCMLMEREMINRDFTNKSFKEAMRGTLYFDMAHEMGHSQGLTHNFIGSFDKANFTNEDGSESQRNYSSIMDYFDPADFHWDGIGTYDIHALRASHLGLLEVTPDYIKTLASKNMTNALVDGKYMSIDNIQKNFAPNGWVNFTSNNVAGVLKTYQYCTDIDVGYNPTCQRFDYGTSAADIVDGLIRDYQNHYVLAYYGWDRLNFDYDAVGNAVAGSMRSMLSMRQFMDELFYKLTSGPKNDPTVPDYLKASLKAYFFFNQVVRTPDTKSGFISDDRFVAVPYQANELDASGKPTGKKVTAVEVIERRAPENIAIRKDRLDTVGYEYDKSIALRMLTMRGYDAYKYDITGYSFSFLDFEKYMLGAAPNESLIVGGITSILSNDLTPTFSNKDVLFMTLPSETAMVTPAIRAHAAIDAILESESTGLRDKDNFANLFKVGSSLGKSPSDRIGLSTLDVSNTSSARVVYWALDNASAAQDLLSQAKVRSAFIQNSNVIVPLMEKMIVAQMALFNKGPQADVDKAAAAVIAKLNDLNKNGDIMPAALVKKNAKLSIENQIQALIGMNKQYLGIAVGVTLNNADAMGAVKDARTNADQLAEVMPLFALDQKALKAAAADLAKSMGTQTGFEMIAKLPDAMDQLVDGTQTEIKYGLIMKNLDFLNKLTLMTNPEYNR